MNEKKFLYFIEVQVKYSQRHAYLNNISEIHIQTTADFILIDISVLMTDGHKLISFIRSVILTSLLNTLICLFNFLLLIWRKTHI